MPEFDHPNTEPSPGLPGPPDAGAGGAEEGPPPEDVPVFMWMPREDPYVGELKSDEKTMGMLCHLLGIVTFIGPLVIWLIKKDESRYVDTQGKEALNFQLSMFILMVGLTVVTAVLSFIPFVNCLLLALGPLAALVPVFSLVMLIIASIKANEGKVYRYPLSVRIIR